jgi:hypothetical protein
MKPGELMQISDPEGTYVVNLATGYSMPEPYPEGTPVLVLGEHEVLLQPGDRKIRILIDGILGWVYESELEVIDESR